MVKNIISYIPSFIMVALIIAIVAVSFLQNKVLNEDYWKMQMEQNNYYEKLEDTVNDGFENYIMQSGMDSSVFEGIYDLDKVKEDTNSIVHAILNNEEFKIETEQKLVLSKNMLIIPRRINYDALEVNDNLILLRCDGGQRYLILDEL